MITASMIHRYGIVTVQNRDYDIAVLLDEDMRERLIHDAAVLCEKGNMVDFVLGISRWKGVVSVQSIVFRSEAGYRKYLQDGAVVFDN